MAAYRRVYDSRHLQADCQELGSAPEPYARQSSMGSLYLFNETVLYSNEIVHTELAKSSRRAGNEALQQAAVVECRHASHVIAGGGVKTIATRQPRPARRHAAAAG